MQLLHNPTVIFASFDDHNLISTAGLIPTVALAEKADLTTLAQDRLSITVDKSTNAGAKITILIAGVVAGADSIDDMDLLRRGGMSTLFDRIYAPSTLGSFFRAFTFGHVRQFDAIATINLNAHAVDGIIGTSADNALAESFNAALKGEVLQDSKTFANHLVCRRGVFRWCTRYNTVRRHSWCRYLAPAVFESRNLAILRSAS